MRTPLITLAVLAIACGTPTDSPKPDPVVPVPTLVPAVITVTTGDAQTAEPGATITVKPVVAVKDAGGRAVPGVLVNFAIDSGGGSVQTTSAVTAVDGTASPGDWRLGATESRNVMRVTAGALTPIKIVAVAAVPTVTLVTQVVPSTGGILQITTGVLAGMKLVIPAGAFPVASTWTLEQQSNASWPRRRGVNPNGAVLRITSTDTIAAAKPLQLTLPYRPIPGTKPFVLMRNPVTNAMDVMQTVLVDSTTITVVAAHFDATKITASPPGGASFAARQVTGRVPSYSYDTPVVVSNIPFGDLDADFDTGFRPGVDDWDMVPADVSLSAEDRGSRQLGSVALGAVISSMAYFATLKKPNGPLFKKYREIPEVALSNQIGMRTSAAVAYDHGLTTLALLSQVGAIRAGMRAGQADQVFHDVLKAGLLITGLPQLVVAQADVKVPLTVFRVVAGRFELANPMTPGTPTAVQFSEGAFSNVNLVVGREGETQRTQWFGAINSTTVLFAQAAAMLERVAAGQTPYTTGDPFVSGTFKARGGVVEDTIVIMGHEGDSTRLWLECADCGTRMASSLSSRGVEAFQGYFRLPDNSLSAITGPGPDGKLLLQREGTERRVGMVMLETNGTTDLYLGFKWLRFKRWVMELSPVSNAFVGSPSVYTASISGPELPPRRYAWTFGEGATAKRFTTATPSIEFTWDQAGAQTVRVELQRTSDNRVLTAATSTVTAKGVFAAWKFTSINILTTTTGPSPLSNPSAGTFLQFLWDRDLALYNNIKNGTSAGGLIFIPRDTTFDGSFKKRGLYVVDGPNFSTALLNTALRLPERGNWADASTANVRGSWLVNDEATFAVADMPFFNQRWSQVGSLTSGNITGLSWDSWTYARLPNNPANIVFPDFTRDATVIFSGTSAAGTINNTARGWTGNFLPETRRYTMTITFTANRIQ